MSNLSELKTLLSGIGGTPLASDTNDETIGKIASLAPEKMLPTVSTSDSGKVLTVNSSGEWEPSSGGGGTGGGVLVCTVDADTGALDHTWQEISDAGYAVLDLQENGICPTIQIADNGGYGVLFLNFSTSSNLTFVAQTADDYPVYDNGGGGGGVTPA